MGELMAQHGDLGHPWGLSGRAPGVWGQTESDMAARPRLPVQPITLSLEVQRAHPTRTGSLGGGGEGGETTQGSRSTCERD